MQPRLGYVIPVMAEKGKLKAMGERPVTWQQAVSVLAAFAVGIFAILMFSEGEGAQELHRSASVGLLLSTAVLAIFTYWHFHRIRKPDLVPDILAQMVPVDQIRQIGRCHLYIAVRPRGVGVEVGVFAQNLTDGLGTLRLRFVPTFSIIGRSIVIPELECDVPPAAVVHAHGCFASDYDRSSTQRLYAEGEFYSAGKQIRFARRSVITKRMSLFLSLGLGLTGHYHRRGGVYIEIGPDPANSADQAVDFNGQWTTSLTWSPDTESLQSSTR
jgi:hypothetical protein